MFQIESGHFLGGAKITVMLQLPSLGQNAVNLVGSGVVAAFAVSDGGAGGSAHTDCVIATINDRPALATQRLRIAARGG